MLTLTYLSWNIVRILFKLYDLLASKYILLLLCATGKICRSTTNNLHIETKDDPIMN